MTETPRSVRESVSPESFLFSPFHSLSFKKVLRYQRNAEGELDCADAMIADQNATNFGFPMKFTVARRSFLAKQHRLGSIERAWLNLSALTSEYMPRYKFVLLQDGKETSFTCTTRADTEAKAHRLTFSSLRPERGF